MSGNVSLYNQTGTPGDPAVADRHVRRRRARRRRGARAGAAAPGRASWCWSASRATGSTARPTGARCCASAAGRRRRSSLEHEARLQELAVAVAEGRWVQAAHDVVGRRPRGRAGRDAAVRAARSRGSASRRISTRSRSSPRWRCSASAPGIVYEVGLDRLPRAVAGGARARAGRVADRHRDGAAGAPRAAARAARPCRGRSTNCARRGARRCRSAGTRRAS